MSDHAAFDLVREETIPEVNSLARHYRHRKTGAEVLSLVNDDENKVFGITLKTPPDDSTGIAHILEHSVLCGSRKYPVKKPFVELIKGSMHTFLNAMTFPDKTAYPVASQNLADFYNLVDVYLDSVFFPLITEGTFRQEGWHYEANGKDEPLVYKGVVFNEMKGVYSTPEAVLREAAQLSLYPDNTYGVNSGGEPKVIPELTYKQFKDFHAKYYHPSNTRAFFYGDDDPAKRLALLDEYFSLFEPIEVEAIVALQPRFNEPRNLIKTYAGGREDGSTRTGLVSINWMLDPFTDETDALAMSVLEYALVGTAASPLRKALTDSGLIEGLTGAGMSDDYRQPMFSIGMKGLEEDKGGEAETLVVDTLRKLADQGIDPKAVAAAVNTLEFVLRENNTGSFPLGIALMFRSMRTWLHDGDPLDPLAFEDDLNALKERIAKGGLFEKLIRERLVDNQHRTTVLLKADKEQGEREKAEERERLAAVRAGMDDAAFDEVIEMTRRLKELQEAADNPDDLKKIPTLTLSDLPRQNKKLPIEESTLSATRLFTHDLPTNGIIYLDLGFDLHTIPADLLPYVPLFSRAMMQTGTAKEDFVSLSQRIGRSTGGIGPSRATMARADNDKASAWLFLRGKAVAGNAEEMLAIMHDVITSARLDNHERVRQMVLEEKAGLEGRLAGMGNGLVSTRLKASLHEADWASEQMGGIDYLFFIRDLAKRIDSDWASIEAAFKRIRDLLVNKAGMVVNVTADHAIWAEFRGQLMAFLDRLPQGKADPAAWGPLRTPKSEGLTFPAQVNYVGKGADLKQLGFKPSGATAVAIKHLNTGWLWDKVRVQGGAYGGSSSFDQFSGGFTFTSYRDPNVTKTIDAYDAAAQFLNAAPTETELTRSIIGVIGTIDTYRMPDAKGFTAMMRVLSGDTEEARQRRREEVLGASAKDFRALSDALAQVAKSGQVVVLGSEAAIKAANDERGGFLQVTRVL